MFTCGLRCSTAPPPRTAPLRPSALSPTVLPYARGDGAAAPHPRRRCRPRRAKRIATTRRGSQRTGIPRLTAPCFCDPGSGPGSGPDPRTSHPPPRPHARRQRDFISLQRAARPLGGPPHSFRGYRWYRRPGRAPSYLGALRCRRRARGRKAVWPRARSGQSAVAMAAEGRPKRRTRESNRAARRPAGRLYSTRDPPPAGSGSQSSRRAARS